MKRLFTLITLLFATTVLSYGQATSVNGGSIQGTITDPSGAVVSGVTVTIVGTDTGSTKTITSDSAGFYSVGPLNPGPYTVTVSGPGFQKLSVKTVVRTGTSTPGSFKLTLGSSAETVEVNAGALQINTDQPGVSDVMTREQIESLPINGRNFLDLAQIQPGVILQSGESFDPTKAGYSAISVGGQSGRTTRILLDGQDITDETVGTTIVNVPSGAVDEFQLNRSTQDVSGEVTSTGQVLVATRSGTNAFHGDLFYNFQDHSVGFARTDNGFDAPFQRNQFGGGVGGPILKDRLFFFGESERIKQDSQTSASAPPTFLSVQQQFPTIPAAFRDTFSTARLDYNGPFGGHYFVRGFYESNADSSNFGLLYQLYENRDNVPGINGGADFATGHFTHSIRGGYEKFHNLIADGTGGVTSIYNPANLGLPGVTLYDSTDGFYAGPNYLAPQGTFQSDKQLRYDGTWTRGAHSIKYGANLNRLLGGGFAEFYGASLFTEFSAGSALASCGGVMGAAPCLNDPLNGYAASSYTLGNGNSIFTEKPGFGLPGGGVEDWRTGVYFADSWKATTSLTIVAGLRYSIDTDRANQDLPAIPCSSVDQSIAPCSGSANLLDQFAPGHPGYGNKVHQPYGNIAPQFGFAFSPGDHKTSVRGGIGIFYESDIFNNTSNARSLVINASGPFFNATGVCGGTNSVPLPGGGLVTSVNGVPLSTICAEPISQSAPAIQQVSAQYQAATKANNTSSNPGFIGGGGGLSTGATGTIYAAPYRTPYSIQFNGGVQHEFGKGTIVTVDYVHNATLKVPIIIDQNHLGAARTLNVAAAQNAIAATTSSFGCVGGFSSAAINCALAAGATITDFAGNGLDSAAKFGGGFPAIINGNTPATGAAFPGLNPAVGFGYFVVPQGRSGYDALQVVVKEQKSHPAPGILSANFQASYSLSMVTTASKPGTGGSDQFFNSYVWNQDDPNSSLGRASLDHTNELSFGGAFLVKYGPTISMIGHFFSAPPTSLTLDNTSGNPGEIFRTDVDGDGQTGDLLPGTLPGDYMHRVKPTNLGATINNFNATKANNLTPAGQALVTAGLFSPGQLVAANAVVQPIATLPTTRAISNAAFRSFDLSASYPIRLSRVREGLSIEPVVSMYNVFNMANFGTLTGTLADVNTANGPTGANLGSNLNAPDTFANLSQTRTQRGSGTFAQGAPRTTEFQLKLHF
ncbi:carboxypeptidase regulatory-like domain-containing protein [Tunturiibacter empetritectus]|uniref:TonB-dependent transporter Oar-like beta-barrel domain-containing protein n=2 Tax=Tunturiibacter TaxID=3154218 RepID=A0A852VS15_9BACT|nr:carboxypeptidase regulatory-like domain-containing protein [Edaphobacter lichenicola]NYF92112.1 hypothetical protein [Edaphobacter lichenicola]